ncbi:MAG: VOC family protein [Patescibacteria group bacterium]|nr:VOC family protein [Patescibacteria group bacterium]MDE1966404.1 VOC family protein [Patescibacteria group bacterium]
MLDHIGLHVNDLEKSKAFYLAALKPLGYEQLHEFAEWNVVGLGADGKADLWLTGDGAKQAQHVCFRTTEKTRVDAFHEDGLKAGGKDNGAPGYRKDYSPGYYAAFVLDPSGHNIEVVWHDPGAE